MADRNIDIEIAQQAEMWPISKVAETIGLGEDMLVHYGRY